LDVDAELAQFGAKKVGIYVLGFPGQHFIANDDDTGGFGHALFLSQWNSRKQARHEGSRALSLLIELAATHEKLASGIGADEAAFLVEEL
jgi:hypothetical protein